VGLYYGILKKHVDRRGNRLINHLGMARSWLNTIHAFGPHKLLLECLEGVGVNSLLSDFHRIACTKDKWIDAVPAPFPSSSKRLLQSSETITSEEIIIVGWSPKYR